MTRQECGWGLVQGAQWTDFLVNLPGYLERKATKSGREVFDGARDTGVREGGKGEDLGLG